MPIDPGEVLRIAKLARIRITGDEAEALARDLERIVASMEQLNEVELPDDAESLTYFDSDVHREDRAAESLSQQDALLNAPATDGQRFLVPQILEKDEA